MSIILLALILVALMPCAAEFAEYPVNITLPIGSGTKAVFRCRHQSIEAIIGWRVNGSAPGLFPNITPGFIDENGNKVSTLTVLVSLEYNKTEVVCVAFFINGSPEVTPTATLTIIEEEGPATIETMETPTMTVEVTTTVEMTLTDFIEVPSPPLTIVTLEETHTYMCNHTRTDRIVWRVNGSLLGFEISPPNIATNNVVPPGGGKVSTLTIGGYLEHNRTTIQCAAKFSDDIPGDVSEVTPIVKFLIQGLLPSVNNISRNFSTITWVPPFSLDLTNADPDIVYCAEVYNITCGRSLLISECDVMETSYTNDALLPGYIYEYTVTPRSNVEGASNGTSAKVTEKFNKYSKAHKFTILDDAENRSDTVLVTIHLVIHLNQSLENKILANSYAILLNSVDGDETQVVLIINNGSTLIFEVTLPYRRQWTYTVLAYGCDQHPVTSTINLSTHDIQDIYITSPSPGEIRVTGKFIQGSTSTGVVIAVLASSEIYFYLLTSDGHEFELNDTISSVAGGEYYVSVFVVDENGLPFSRTATIPQNVSVIKGIENQTFSIEYELVNFTSAGVCVNCTFLDPSALECVAIVHQQISQLRSSGLMNIESSHKFNRSGDTAYGCIEGVNLEQYQVGVVGETMKEQMVTENTEVGKNWTEFVEESDSYFCQWCFIGPIVGLTTTTVVVVVILMVCCVSYKVKKIKYISDDQKRMDQSDNVVELVKCEAYEVVKLSRQRVTMNYNPAYGEIGMRVHAE